MQALPLRAPAKPSVLLLALLGASLAGCTRKAEPEPSAEPSAPAASVAAAAKSAPAPASAKLGAPAPDFTLNDLDGRPVSLSSFRGKAVVLEWFNPGCPFVKASHTKGSLVDTAARHAKSGVVWLAVNSGAPGKQGHGIEANRAGREQFKLEHPILLDEDGRVGHAYAAAHTPHLYVINKEGVLVYRGAIDNSPDAEGESPAGGKLINYVDAALSDLDAGRPVATPETEAYGCSVKYGG
ncbi:MAG TPA: thioredoxin family protein [Polyangiaceae bacterium]|nr:thioredoxin family protein [Polyangiaceae bacterium]